MRTEASLHDAKNRNLVLTKAKADHFGNRNSLRSFEIRRDCANQNLGRRPKKSGDHAVERVIESLLLSEVPFRVELVMPGRYFLKASTSQFAISAVEFISQQRNQAF